MSVHELFHGLEIGVAIVIGVQLLLQLRSQVWLRGEKLIFLFLLHRGYFWQLLRAHELSGLGEGTKRRLHALLQFRGTVDAFIQHFVSDMGRLSKWCALCILSNVIFIHFEIDRLVGIALLLGVRADSKGSFGAFATHFLELSLLAQTEPIVANYGIENQLLFLF